MIDDFNRVLFKDLGIYLAPYQTAFVSIYVKGDCELLVSCFLLLSGCVI